MADNRGSIGWHDLTVADAPGVRDFYSAVVGWTPVPLTMGEYDDYIMTQPGTDEAAAGICHARGSNANIPPQWLIYINVADLDASLAACHERGGSVVDGPREMAGGRFAVVKDPAGAVCGLWQPGADREEEG